MAKEKLNMLDEYKGDLVRIINSSNSNFNPIGFLKDFNQDYVSLFPYLSSMVNKDGQTIHYYCSEGKPLKVDRKKILAIHLTTMELINNYISYNGRIAKIEAMKTRIDEIQTKLNLNDMEEAYRKKFRKEDEYEQNK